MGCGISSPELTGTDRLPKSRRHSENFKKRCVTSCETDHTTIEDISETIVVHIDTNNASSSIKPNLICNDSSDFREICFKDEMITEQHVGLNEVNDSECDITKWKPVSSGLNKYTFSTEKHQSIKPL
jgi:hypothetical protein